MSDEYYKNNVLGISNQQSSIQKRPKSNADNIKPVSHVEKTNFVGAAPQQQLDANQKKRAQSKEPEVKKIESPVKPIVK